MVDMNVLSQGGGTKAQNSQRLPSFAIFLSLSTPDETKPVVTPERPSSTMVAAQPVPGISSSNCYPENPSPTSAGDRFRNWFPETSIKPEAGTVLTDSWSNKASPSTFPLNSNSTRLHSALLGSQIEQDASRRTSLPSISSLTSQQSHDEKHSHNLWRRASTSNTVAGNNHLPSLHSSPGTVMLPPTRDLTLPSARVPSTPGSCVLPTRPASLDRQPPEFVPSPPPPSPATSAVQRRGSPDSESRSSNSSRKNDRNKKNRIQSKIKRIESDRTRYQCPFEGCGLLYTWKENLARHTTTSHDAMLTPRRCPFCHVNAERLSFNRIDNYKEHILRHTRRSDNGRTRTRYHPAAAEFYRRLTDESRSGKQRGRGRRRRLSPGSVASDDSIEVSDGV